MAVMPEMLQYTQMRSPTKTCIIGKTQNGEALVTFVNETEARQWLAQAGLKGIKFYRRTTTIRDEEIKL